MFSEEIRALSRTLLDACRTKSVHIATAESCTGGLIAAALTEIAGSSDVFERGFVTYQNEAKAEDLGVLEQTLLIHGAVSEPVARQMAEGALNRSASQVSVAVTGVAGPGGGSVEKPVGLVHIASASTDGETLHLRCEFGDIGREDIREATVSKALNLLAEAVGRYSSNSSA
jgi:nicotinamide-nucleotide amidase